VEEESMGTQLERPPAQSAVRLGVPLIAATALTAVLLSVLPPKRLPDVVIHPAVVAGVCWAGQLWYVSYSLEPSTLVGILRGEVFGLANTVTLLRGSLYAVVAGFVVVPAETMLAWVPAVCYGAGVVLDKLDGTIARTIGEETPLGTRLDMAFDTFGFVAAPLVAVLWGALPVYYLAISVVRYAFLGAVRLHRWRGGTVHSLPDSDLGKYLAGVQMAFVTVALVPAVPTVLVYTVAPIVLAPSIAVFARDYCYVTGRLGSGH
jgi:CDP-diacylglycerol--glycerol-3-phosphate 3-phosphatidyltransferase